MDAEAVLSWVDTLVLSRTGQRLSDLQRTILRKVWQGKKYLEIAAAYGCTEGHVKDVSADLWRFLSKHLGEKITKGNCRHALARYLQAADSPTLPTPYSPPPTPHSLPIVGRTAAIAHLDTLVHQGSTIIVIQGEGGLGKTTLAQQYLYTHGFELVLELLMAKETPAIASAERVVEEWLRQDFGQEPAVEFGINLDRLKRQLYNRRIGVLIDNLEPALDGQGRFIAPHRSYIELLRVLADARVQSVTLVTSRDRLCEASLNVAHYRLPGLEQWAWQQFFSQRDLTIDQPTLQQMHHAYGGNAKAMGLLCGAIQADHDGDMACYWHENQVDLGMTADLKALVMSQVDRLQAFDPQSYRLFCRLGNYRYQDVPTISTAGVCCLLWDVLPEQHRQTIASLRHRSLVEYHNGEYWLHPVIRAEAIARLRASDDWENTNRSAATFWTDSVPIIETTKDALKALEAYYHYIEIHDFVAAAKVILKSRHNQWQQFLPLGSMLYRMGLIQPVLTAINQVIQHLKSDQNLTELYNILGDLCWILGRIEDAIAHQEQTILRASQTLESLDPGKANSHQIYYLKMLTVDSLLSIGLYNVDLWELDAAASLFQQVIDQAAHTAHHSWAEKASVCLALVKSYLGASTEAIVLADSIYESYLTEQLVEKAGRFAYFMQILGQTYVNLGKFAKAHELFQRTLTFAEAGYYTQVKARTLNGLAEIHRQTAHFENALKMHQDAIDLLEKIGAKCDLAEAYFQLGLTQQMMGDIEQSQTSCDRAIQLFTDIQSPRQVEKVLQRTAYVASSLSQP